VVLSVSFLFSSCEFHRFSLLESHSWNIGFAVLYSEALNDIYALDPSTMTWTNLTAPETTPEGQHRPSPRGYLGLAAVAGKVYVFGGADDNGGEFAVADASPAVLVLKPMIRYFTQLSHHEHTHFSPSRLHTF
jgi:hypothetical protein